MLFIRTNSFKCHDIIGINDSKGKAFLLQWQVILLSAGISRCPCILYEAGNSEKFQKREYRGMRIVLERKSIQVIVAQRKAG